jgi:hypothetical protein
MGRVDGQSQLNLGPMEGKALTQARVNASSSDEHAVTPSGVKDLLTLVTEAVDHGTCSEKVAAVSLGLPSQQYWSAVKSRERPAPRLNRLTDLPESTQREICRRWAAQVGLRCSDENTQHRVLVNLVEAAVQAIREVG